MLINYCVRDWGGRVSVLVVNGRVRWVRIDLAVMKRVVLWPFAVFIFLVTD